MPAWPGTLPTPNLGGYSEQYIDPVIRTQMDSGPTKRRLRYTAVPKQVSVSLTLTNAQVQTLEAFYRDDLGYGSLPFDFENPRPPHDAVEIAFTEPPTVAGGTDEAYDVRMSWEILP